MLKLARAATLALALALPLAAAAADVTVGDLTISDLRSPATAPNAMSGAGYLTITNSGDTDDRLLSASSSAGNVMLHKSETDDAGVARMVHQMNGVPIPAGSTVMMAPGGLHLMFMGLTEPFAEGTSHEVTLMFEHAGDVTVTLPVTETGAMKHDH